MTDFGPEFRRTRISRVLCCAFAAVTAGVLVPLSSKAQTADAPAAGTPTAPPAASGEVASTEPASGIEQITVSARKREESVADVPSSITVFTAQTLEDYNIQSFTDYATK
ncbi:MAG TPA: hypothetical protein VH278_12375, partial [Burkholderiaceae bacterium]|nr:hypothetical protein [Burkholderiaceae bacterium]